MHVYVYTAVWDNHLHHRQHLVFEPSPHTAAGLERSVMRARMNPDALLPAAQRCQLSVNLAAF